MSYRIPFVALEHWDQVVLLPLLSYEDASRNRWLSFSTFCRPPEVLNFDLLRLTNDHTIRSDGGQVTSKVTIPMIASLDSCIFGNFFGPYTNKPWLSRICRNRESLYTRMSGALSGAASRDRFWILPMGMLKSGIPLLLPRSEAYDDHASEVRPNEQYPDVYDEVQQVLDSTNGFASDVRTKRFLSTATGRTWAK